ncbi:replication protein [Clostridium sporogenes]|nr:replication protein [Clostridium lundense]NFE67788.1 replication protein [Clostridium sporogenes]NFG98467.1 replication protein [Clostridium sporogenes]NFH33819.1 replication protein [Clostridium sporogenes]NFL20991.1 replication protein [Clostridium sporogenes]
MIHIYNLHSVLYSIIITPVFKGIKTRNTFKKNRYL